jgi:multiple sugar transport system permease protein
MSKQQIVAAESGRGATADPTTKSGRRRRRLNEMFTAWMFMAPAALGLLVFMVIPFLMAFYLSLTDTRLMSPDPPELIGLENYSSLLRIDVISMDPLVDEETGEVVLDEEGNVQYPRARTILRGNEEYDGLREYSQIDLFGSHYLIAAGDPTFWRGLINNFKFALIVVPLQSAFALLLAILVNQKIRGANIYRALYFTPVVVSMVVVAVIWFFLYNPGVGTINSFIETITFGLVGPQEWLVDPQLAFPSIMLMSIWQGVGFQMVIFLAGLQEIPGEVYEAAAIDGCNRFQEFFYVTLPQLRNTTIFVVIATTILSFQLFTQVDIMTGGGPSEATMTTILHAVNEGRRQLRAGYASAITVVFFLIVLAISIIQRVVVREEKAVS